MHPTRLGGVRTFISFQRSLNTKVPQDVFGSLSRSGGKVLAIQSVEKFAPEDPDGYDKEEFDLGPRKNAFFYKYEISKYARQGSLGLKKALELFNTMKSRDRLSPTVDNFSPLIYGCAKAGYTKKAFDLYEESQKYVKKPTKSVVTCLLNACAESPFPEYGLKRLDWFIKHLRIDNQYNFTEIHYRAAIKAYGKLGQLVEASKLVNDMIESGFTPDVHTFNQLLIGCASNREEGCTLALRIFKVMRMYGIKPDIITYAQMLRCIRDCGVGSEAYFRQALFELPAMMAPPKNKSDGFKIIPHIANVGKSISLAVQKEDLKQIEQSVLRTNQTIDLLTNTPNLLSDNHFKFIQQIEAIDVAKLENAQGRIMIFGGLRGFLSQMIEDGCQPDKKIFTLLLYCLGYAWHHHLDFLKLAKEHSIERDPLFWNAIIRRVCKNSYDTYRYHHVAYLLEEMQSINIRPSILTFESMSFICDSLEAAQKFIGDVERCGFVISDVIIFNLFSVAQKKMDFRYLRGLISIASQRKFHPKEALVENLEAMILEFQRSHLQTTSSDFDSFKTELYKWFRNVELHKEDHPWRQFYVAAHSKKRGFSEFVGAFKTLEKLKHDAIERGVNFGNLMARAEKDKIKSSNNKMQEDCKE